jgi:cytochrome b561
MTLALDPAHEGKAVPAAPSLVSGGYPASAMVLHWAVTALVFALVASGVIAKQLGTGDVAGLMYSLHKLVGALTFFLLLGRLVYRLIWSRRPRVALNRARSPLHWTLYGFALVVPLLGWAGISDFGAREIFPGFSLPAIWPEGAGYDGLLLQFHAYFAFGLLALVALHIGAAIQDYMNHRAGS